MPLIQKNLMEKLFQSSRDLRFKWRFTFRDDNNPEQHVQAILKFKEKQSNVFYMDGFTLNDPQKSICY